MLLLEGRGVIPSNYADDNSLSVAANIREGVITKVEEILRLLLQWFSDNLMKANIEKFQFMLLSPNVNSDENCTVIVNNVTIENLDECKLLGVYIDKGLSYSKHINTICSKANAKLLALKRLANFLTVDCRLSLLRSFIVCHYLYCAALLHFSNKKLKDKIERTVYRGLKLVFNDYKSTYDELLKRANMDSLELQRQKAIITEMYKCLKGIGPEYLRDVFNFRSNGRRGPIFDEPRVRTAKFGTHSLRAYGPKLWNRLHIDIRTAENLTYFKTQLKNFEGLACRCAFNM